MVPQPPIRVLYIDDDPGIRRLVQRRLQASGIHVVLAGGADEGLALVSTEPFDAVALDHYMPGRDGLELLAELRAVDDPPPVVFVTAAEEPRIAIAALKEGAEDYVLKDVQGAFLDLLGPTLLQAVERARMRRAKEAAEREVRESRDRLERLAAQQEILLREVNHRVANSLQLISSLIELQARRVGEDGAREMLKRAAQRVEAVAMVHRRLYTSQDVEVVEMDQYLIGMIDELGRAVAADGEGHAIELSAEPVKIPTDTAVSIGLIVNELVTNALKYAYPDGMVGAIRVVFRTIPGNAVSLIVEDDGVGLMRNGVEPRGTGLGTTIVLAMAEKLRATLRQDESWRGTRFVLEVPT